MALSRDLLLILGVTLVVVCSLFRTPWVIAARLLLLAMHVTRWLIILGLVTALWNLPQTYAALGWTPFSLLFGDSFYAKLDRRTSPKPRAPSAHVGADRDT